MNDEFQTVLNGCKKEFKEVTWWLNRAIFASPIYRGECTRKIKTECKNELDFYDVGKVFRFQNVISATKGPSESDT